MYPLRHWMDELSDKEQNRIAQSKGLLGQLAQDRVLSCIQECLRIYNGRHKGKDLRIDPNPNLESADLKWIRLVHPTGIGFDFIIDRPTLTWHHLSREGKLVEDTVEILVIEDETSPIYEEMMLLLRANGGMRTIDQIVRETLEPVLFQTPFRPLESSRRSRFAPSIKIDGVERLLW